MSGCKCEDCCKTKCVNTCLLLSEPCNPCPPKVMTYCVPAPYDPCNPCNPCDPCNPCPPDKSSTNPKNVIYPNILGSGGGALNPALTATQTNSYNYFIFNPSNDTLVVNLPAISSLNNGGQKNVHFVNISAYSMTVNSATSDGSQVDTINSAVTATTTINKETTLILTSMPTIKNTPLTGSIWSIVG
jgi:hypothetical protein